MECKCESCVRQDCQERTKQDDSRIVTCCSDYLERKTTNADRIRAMSDEELAVLLANVIPHDCFGCNLDCSTSDGDKFENCCHNAFYKWLKQPAEVE